MVRGIRRCQVSGRGAPSNVQAPTGENVYFILQFFERGHVLVEVLPLVHRAGHLGLNGYRLQSLCGNMLGILHGLLELPQGGPKERTAGVKSSGPPDDRNWYLNLWS
ncbi:hypothetical protein NDU88_004528 [Pleurodeles waltl]|uniref:Uncharacterized protein n=1 Tax=Pleurodeles waltl TaxID=8319 RepID=A0AAV7PEC6_PLEWA|nr:hypothetical protein NDU88_004528 [Pleurodeles waltl]